MSKLAAGCGYRRDLPHGLMFHRFHTASAPHGWQGALTPEEFERILLYVGVDRILSPDEWMSRLQDGRLGSEDLCVTFDDGLRCQTQHALPVLERHGLRAFWFVYSCVADGIVVKSEIYSYVAGQIGGMPALIDEFLERCPSGLLRQLESEDFIVYANRLREVAPFYTANDLKYRFLRDRVENTPFFEEVMDQILRARGFEPAEIGRQLWLDDGDLRMLAVAGHHVGLHSYDHPYAMAEFPREAQRMQYERNHTHITAATGTKPRSMSHPLNSYDEDSLSVLNDLGIRCGFRANLAPAHGRVNPSALEWAREDSATLLLMVH